LKKICEIKEAVKLSKCSNSGPGAMQTVGETQIEVAPFSSATIIRKSTCWRNLIQRLAISSIVVGSAMTYLIIYLLSGHLFWHLTGVQTNEYVYATINACGIGLVLTALCYMEFLHRFLDLKNNIFYLLAALAAAVFVTCTLTDGLQGVWVTTACCLAALTTGKLAQQARQAIPNSFRYSKAIFVSAMASLPAAFVSVYIFASAAADTSTAPVVFADGTCGEEIAAAVALFVFLTIPAYAFARCARTNEAKPLIALGFLQISPLIFGVLAQLVLLSSAVNAVPLAVSGLVALAFGTLCVSWGSSAGALVNGVHHRRKMNRISAKTALSVSGGA